MRKYRLQNRNGQGSMFSSLDVDMIATVDVIDDERVLVTFGYQPRRPQPDVVKMHAAAHAEAASFVGSMYEAISAMRDEHPALEYQVAIETLASGGPRGLCGQNARVEVRGRDAVTVVEGAFGEGVVHS